MSAYAAGYKTGYQEGLRDGAPLPASLSLPADLQAAIERLLERVEGRPCTYGVQLAACDCMTCGDRATAVEVRQQLGAQQ